MANAHDLLMAQRAAMIGGKELPYDEELDWLSCNGNQYIDTGIKDTSVFGFDIRFLKDGNASSNYPCILSAYVDQFCIFVGWYSGGYGIAMRNRNSWISWTSQSPYGEVHMNAKNGVVSMNGIEKNYPNPNLSLGNNNVNVTIFAGVFGASRYCNNGHCSSFDLFDSEGNPVSSCLPVLKDGVPCFYDSVRKLFLYNAVSGHQFGYKKKDGTVVNPT